MKGTYFMKITKYTLDSGVTKWKFYHYLGINPDTGKKNVIQRQGFNSHAEARQTLIRIIQEYEEGMEVKKNNKYRFAEMVKLWLKYYKTQVKITTYSNRETLIRIHIMPIFKDYYIDKIDVKLCQEAVDKWYSSYSEASRLVNLTNQIFKFAINRGYCKDNQMEKIIRPKNTYKEDYQAPFYEKEELQIFLEAVKYNRPYRAYAMFHVLAYTGLRRGELFALKWKDVDFKNKTLNVKRNLIYDTDKKIFRLSKPKTKNSIRVISLDAKTLQILLTWRNYQREFFLKLGMNVNSPEQIVFTSATNRFITDCYLRRIVTSITEQYNLPHITVHGFRHTHCSLLFAAGVDMQNVKDRLGHSDIKTTMNIYAHVTKTERDKTADLFGDFMNAMNH